MNKTYRKPFCGCGKSTDNCTCEGSELHPMLPRMPILPLSFECRLEEPVKSTGPTGIKHDQGKPDMSLLSSTALFKIAEVMSYGKKKYSAHNWRGGFIWSRPLAAAARHLYAYINGEDKDPETGLSHLAHACCCLFFVLEFEETHKELDDRYGK